MSDEELVKGCLAKDPAAQKLLFDTYSRKMMGVCLRYADDADEAQDMLQNGFIRVFEKLDSFKAMGSLEGWIRKIVVNESLTWIRKNKYRQNDIALEDVKTGINDESKKGTELNEKDLLKMIAKLPTGFRTVFNLYAIEGYSHKEIAEMLGITEGTSKSQYARAKAQLQKALSLEYELTEKRMA